MVTDSDGQPPAPGGSGADGHGLATAARTPWRDPALPVPVRVADLMGRLSLVEKVNQLCSYWISGSVGEGEVAPFQHEFVDNDSVDWPSLIANGLGQLTRPLGTVAGDPALGARALILRQNEIVAAGRHGIPALSHEECLTGLMTRGATVFPTPLAWGATFDPALVERMAAYIGEAVRSVGGHQGLAPVLDVTRDPRWGRTEETIGEDPYLVGTIGTAYVRGLQSAGVVATLKHFAGYSASRAGRNFGPVGVGRRELADVILPPFEMAVRDGGARSVMHAYTETDGVPAAADRSLLTTTLREEWGFTGTLVADYFGVAFLHLLHQVAGSLADAAGMALAAGLDVELPSVHAFGEPLLGALRDGAIPEALVDRAVERVLTQKCELGLLDEDWSPIPPVLAGRVTGPDLPPPDDVAGTIDLDPPHGRALARDVAERSVVLCRNLGVLPLRPDATVAVLGPLADDPYGMLGCYTFPSHVKGQLTLGIEVPSLLAGLRAELPGARLTHEPGCGVDTDEDSGFPAAVAAAEAADVAVVVLGDRAGLFGHGTSGEGCDVADLNLPGRQADLLDAVVATGRPVVAVLLAGRPYALGRWDGRLAAVVQAFFAGEEGGPAVAGVLSGRVNPSGRLPVSVPRDPGGQPATYLAPKLGHRTEVSTVDPTALYPFGHGLSYATFEWTDVRVDGHQTWPDQPIERDTAGRLTVTVTVRNTSGVAGAEVVQLYLHDPVAQVTRPVVRLIGYARVELAPGEARRVGFGVHADLSAFTGVSGRRVVEPGDLELRLATSSAADDVRHVVRVRLTGAIRTVDHSRELTSSVTVDR